MLLGGGLAAVGVAALAVALVLTLGGPGGSSPAPARSLAAVAGTQRAKTPSPKPTPKPAPAVDPCVVGTWLDTADTQTNTIGGAPTEFTGHGGYMTVQPNGDVFVDYGNETMSANVGGTLWTDVFTGTATMHMKTSGGAMYYTHFVRSPDAYQTLYDNGVENNSIPIAILGTPVRYLCSGNTLRTFSSDGTSVSTRQP